MQLEPASGNSSVAREFDSITRRSLTDGFTVALNFYEVKLCS